MILKQTQVVCKKCSKILTVANLKGVKSATCTCGICHSKIPVNFYVEDRNPATSLSCQGIGEVTSLPRSGKVTEQVAVLVVEGHEYPLSVGNNIVGRWSPTSTADVQLNIHDEFLSRQHVLINVYRLADGNLRVTVRNYRNKNMTVVKGRFLEEGTVVVHDGDTIDMAGTIARVVIRTAE